MTGAMNGFDLNTYSLYSLPSQPTGNVYRPRHCISLRMTGNPLTPHAILIRELLWDAGSRALSGAAARAQSLYAASLPDFGLADGDRDWASSIILLGVRVASLIKKSTVRFRRHRRRNGFRRGKLLPTCDMIYSRGERRGKQGWETVEITWTGGPSHINKCFQNTNQAEPLSLKEFLMIYLCSWAWNAFRETEKENSEFAFVRECLGTVLIHLRLSDTISDKRNNNKLLKLAQTRQTSENLPQYRLMATTVDCSAVDSIC